MPELLPTEMRPTNRRRLRDPGVIIDQDPQEVNPASPMEDVPKAVELTEHWALQLGDKFAGGAYADIHKATMIRPGGSDICQVAVKVLRYHGMAASSQQYEQMLERIDRRLSREMEVWKRLTHPRITPLLAYAQSSSKLLPGTGAALISPYRENANLRTYLSNKPNADKLSLLQQVCEGLVYMHTFEPPIAHLDLKPENILVNDNEEAELCDFGLAKALEDACTGFTTSTLGTAGTLIYMSPEALNAEPQTTESDIYAMGGVILHVMSGDPPWRQTPSVKVMQQVLRGMTPPREEYTISEYASHVVEKIWLLMQRCWSSNPSDRPKAFEVLNILTDLHKSGSITRVNPVELGDHFEQPRREDFPSNTPDDAKSSFPSQDDGTMQQEDMSVIIEHRREVVNSRSSGRLQRDAHLHEMTSALESRHDPNKSPDDLSAAIEHFREAVHNCPPGHPDLSLELQELASALLSRYDRDKNPDDLSEAIKHRREVIELRPPGHPTRDAALNELGVALKCRYDQDKDPDDLSAAIEFLRDTVDLWPPGHPERDAALHNLAFVLLSRYDRDKNPDDLSEAIERRREVAKLRPPEHPKRDAALHDLAFVLLSRYNRDKNPEDLSEAIEYRREIVNLHPPGHSKRDVALHNLAFALLLRYDRDQNPDDLSEAIEHRRETVDLRPPGHPERDVALNGLGIALKFRYNQDKNPTDLSTAIEYLREAVGLRPPGHPERDVALHNLAFVLHSRYSQDKNPDDLSVAIDYFREAIDLRPPGHPNRSVAQYSLANALRARYDMSGGER